MDIMKQPNICIGIIQTGLQIGQKCGDIVENGERYLCDKHIDQLRSHDYIMNVVPAMRQDEPVDEPIYVEENFYYREDYFTDIDNYSTEEETYEFHIRADTEWVYRKIETKKVISGECPVCYELTDTALLCDHRLCSSCKNFMLNSGRSFCCPICRA